MTDTSWVVLILLIIPTFVTYFAAEQWDWPPRRTLIVSGLLVAAFAALDPWPYVREIVLAFGAGFVGLGVLMRKNPFGKPYIIYGAALLAVYFQVWNNLRGAFQ